MFLICRYYEIKLMVIYNARIGYIIVSQILLHVNEKLVLSLKKANL